MNVYAESNFVLELALMQEEYEACEEILNLAAKAKITLVLPAFSIAEPYETLVRRDKTRNQIAQNVRAELRQLGRSRPYKNETDTYQAFATLLLRSGGEEKARFFQTQDRLLKSAEIIPLERNILISATGLQAKHDLDPQDAIVYASVLQHLENASSTPACFLNRNTHDFSDPDIEDALVRHHCKLLFSFVDAYRYITHQIQ